MAERLLSAREVAELTVDLTRCEVQEHGGALSGEVRNAQRRWRERRGLLLRVWSTDGCMGLGEASPLPGHSRETLADCRRALASVSPGTWRVHDAAPLPGAARFALECALLDIIARQRGISVAALLRPPPHQPVPLCALVNDLDAAIAHWQHGICAFKIKVGSNFDAEHALLTALRHHFPRAVLRIDANGAWTPAQAAENLALLAPIGLELAEEPCSGPLPPSPIPLAIDERLAAGDSSALRDGSAAIAIVKPMLLGLVRCLQLAAVHPVIVSHLFDGPVALTAAAELALALRPKHACGLATHAGLTAWPPIVVPQLRGGFLEPHTSIGLGVTL